MQSYTPKLIKIVIAEKLLMYLEDKISLYEILPLYKDIVDNETDDILREVTILFYFLKNQLVFGMKDLLTRDMVKYVFASILLKITEEISVRQSN